MARDTFVLAAVLALEGPFFPTSLAPPTPRADSRRCSIGGASTQSDCALIGAQWVVTTAGAVAAARTTGGRLRVHIGDDEFAVEQLVYHPKWNGGPRFDVTLLKLADRVPAFPRLPLPGELPVNVTRIAQHALEHRVWVSQTIGPSPLWDARGCATAVARRSALFMRVRTLVGVWSGRTSND